MPNFFVFDQKLVIAFNTLWVFDDTINGADLIASWFLIKAHAFGAKVGVDDVGFLSFLVVADGIVWAFWLADVAVDTVGGDFECHFVNFVI